jgi:organic hydroperoxide reductase OsmC/OhrA
MLFGIVSFLEEDKSGTHLVAAGGAKFKASDAYFLLPEGYRDGARIDPEKMFVVAIASAHMPSWLHSAFGMGSEVPAYSDKARGVMTERHRGCMSNGRS